ncbi:MAG: hypothetical protein U1B83_08470 [Candidatus Cloacimonadaceae bacterium]|nr:hypothetical protein [Candidatus Cloacimonadaceae bacterium]
MPEAQELLTNVLLNGNWLLVFDWGYEDQKTIGLMVENGIRPSIHCVGKRNIREEGIERSFKLAVTEMEFQFEMLGFKASETLHRASKGSGSGLTLIPPGRQYGGWHSTFALTRFQLTAI